MDYTKTVKQITCREYEKILTLLSGLRKVPATTIEDISYNNALGDVFDYILENNKDNLHQHTVHCGKWVRDATK